MRWLKVTLALLLILTSFLLILKYVRNTPFFYIGIESFLILIFFTFRIKKSVRLKAFLFNLAVAILFLALAETYLSGRDFFRYNDSGDDDSFKEKETYSNKYYAFDDIRGHVPLKNIKTNVQKSRGDKIIYGAVYTTNEYGLRATFRDLKPQCPGLTKDFKNLVFFGCSYIFGEGVNDNETIPYLVEEKAMGRYRSYNFGFLGYGPQQILSILEADLLDKIINNDRPIIAIYLALPDHAQRVAGRYPYITYNPDGPQYVLDSKGQVKYAGKFRQGFNNEDLFALFLTDYSYLDDGRDISNKLIARVLFQLNKSYLYKMLAHKVIYGLSIFRADIRLFIQVVKRCRDLIAEKYKGDFYLILWPDKSDTHYNCMLSELRKNNIKVIVADQIFNNNFDEKYYSIPDDGHPNGRAYEKIADYLLKNVLIDREDKK